MKKIKWLLLSLLVFTAPAFASYKWAKSSECFTPIVLDATKSLPASEVEDGCYFMLMDLQSNLSSKESYYHYAYKITSENGVQGNSELRIDYNPAYQQLFLNSIRICREGKCLDYSKKVKIKELQREDDLNYYIYDETITVYIILEDIRVGDIVEYSFTRKGSNPVLGNQIYKSFYYQLNYTLLDYHLRIIKSKDQFLKINTQNCDLQPKRVVSKWGEEFIWKMSDVPAVKVEKYLPQWYSSYGLIEMSSSKDWGEVREWGVQVFENNEVLNDSLKAICSRILKSESSEEKRVMAALRYVQKNIRYLGIEIGEGSHRPNSPNKVFKQGFGDCKDKSLLLTKMLKEMDVTAYPALVATTEREHVKSYLPSPTLFNHVITRVDLSNGKSYWVDPTRGNQGGDITNNYLSPYGYALVLNGKGTELDSVVTSSESHIEIKERFIVNDFEGDADLYVTTIYKGADADEIRYTFATTSEKKIQENYLDFYKESYLKIDTVGTIQMKDNFDLNEIIVYEKYKIKDFWKIADTLRKNNINAEVTAYNINMKLNTYGKNFSNRKAPLYLEFPLHLSHSILVKFPVNWDVTCMDKHIDNECFSFDYTSKYSNTTLELFYDYRTKKSYVPATFASTFIADIENAKNVMRYSFSYNKLALSNSMQDFNFILLLLFFMIVAVVLYRLYKINQIYEAIKERVEWRYGNINGWVVLPIIGLFITILSTIFNLFKSGYFDNSTWNLTTISSLRLYQVVLAFELFIQSALIIIPTALLFLAFRFDRRFPQFMIYYYILVVLFSLLDQIGVMLIPETNHTQGLADLARSIVVAAIWIPFFIHSKRCKELFVR